MADGDIRLVTKDEFDAQVAATTEELTEVKKSVSDGKTLVAAAITAKGVTTAADAAFQTMADNIGEIETGVDTSELVNAIPGNIRSGVTIAGITGTYGDCNPVEKEIGASAYAVLTKNNSMEFSMSMMSFDGAFQVTNVDDGEVTVRFPLQAFVHIENGVGGVGYLKTMTVNDVEYAAQGFSSNPSAGDKGYIDVVFDEAEFDAIIMDYGEYILIHVTPSYRILGSIPHSQGSDVRLYFSSAPVNYQTGGYYQTFC